MTINASYIVVLAKDEVVYGTDAVPSLAADALLTRNFQATPIETDTVERPLDRPTVGGRAQAVTNARARLQFEVEAAGSGAAATPAKWARLLRYCGMAAPVAGGGQVTQAFGAPPYSSGTFYYWYENERRRSVGARGTFGGVFEAGSLPYFTFDMTALLGATPWDTSAVGGAPDQSGFREPVEVNNDNTVFSLDGYAAVLRRLEFAANAQVSLRSLVGARYIRRGNHSVSGTLLIEASRTSEKDYLTRVRTGATVALSLTHGTAAGNIVELSMGYAQLTSVSQSVEDDILMYSISFQANVSAGSDDLIITTR